ncbi:MAG: Membrane protein insertase MisCA precursor [bacterium ADurb.Bin363]|nr:MAG: Membrane protein insertase MisCA precursor [bacterium ADurb.Bin363]
MEAGGVIPLEAKFLIWELTKKDPYYILPILNGLIAFVQQKIMSKDSASNPQAEMMAKIFPVMMIVISLGLPSGLQIYWVTSSAISLLQQYFIVKKGE